MESESDQDDDWENKYNEQWEITNKMITKYNFLKSSAKKLITRIKQLEENKLFDVTKLYNIIN